MRAWFEEVLRGLGTVLLIALFWWVFWLLDSVCFGSGATIQGDGRGMVTVDDLRAAHKYHGIMVSYRDEWGWYFTRAGRRCPLFTKGCLERIAAGRARG